MKKSWIFSGVLGVVVVIGGVVGTGFARGQNPNPYGLSSIEKSHIARYFATASRHSDYEVTAAQLHVWLRTSHSPPIIIDVRQPLGLDGYASGHIAGSHNIPLQYMGQELLARKPHTIKMVSPSGSSYIHLFPLPLNRPIVILCYDGNGGEMSPAVLRLLGYQAYSLRWGISAWNSTLDAWPKPSEVAPLPLATTADSQTLSTTPAVGNYTVPRSLKDKFATLWANMNKKYPTG